MPFNERSTTNQEQSVFIFSATTYIIGECWTHSYNELKGWHRHSNVSFIHSLICVRLSLAHTLYFAVDFPLVLSAAFMLASYYTDVSFEFGISILRFMMVWLLLLLLLSLLLHATMLGYTSRQSHFFHQWFNGSYKEENGKTERNTFGAATFLLFWTRKLHHWG